MRAQSALKKVFSFSILPSAAGSNLFFLLVLLLVAVAPGWAQWAQHVMGNRAPGLAPVSASLRGMATIGGRPAVGATIILQDPQTGITVASAEAGNTGVFQIDSIPEGEYLLIAELGAATIHDRIAVLPLQPDIEVRFPAATPDTSSPVVSAFELAIPDKAKHALQEAREAMAKQKVDQAGKKIADALRIAPKYPQALALRAALRLGSGETSEALADLDNAIHLDPNYPFAYFVMGTTYNTLKQYDNAERALKTGMRLDPRAWQGHYEMARALLGKGQPQPALEQLNNALDTAPPNFTELHLLRGTALLQLQRYDECAQELQNFLQKDPNSALAPQVKTVLSEISKHQVPPVAAGAQK